jgi:hypothetical protein
VFVARWVWGGSGTVDRLGQVGQREERGRERVFVVLYVWVWGLRGDGGTGSWLRESEPGYSVRTKE